MARTTSAAVEAVLNRDYDSSPEVGSAPSLTPYIDTASSIVDDLVTFCDDNDIDEPSAVKLELIERWLSAWAYCQYDKTYQSKSTSGASASFSGQTGKGFNSNNYGQTAMMLDPTGYLQSITSDAETNQSSATAGGFWAGKTESDALTYDERN